MLKSLSSIGTAVLAIGTLAGCGGGTVAALPALTTPASTARLSAKPMDNFGEILKKTAPATSATAKRSHTFDNFGEILGKQRT